MLEYSNVMLPLSASLTEKDGVMDLLQSSARLATYLDSITLPLRRANKGHRKLLMTDWCSVLSPRRDMRVVSSEMYIASQVIDVLLQPLKPAVSLDPLSRWSRMIVGRGVDESAWPCETRAEHFAFDEMKLPHSYPLGIFPPPPQDFASSMRTGRVVVSAGTSNNLYPWLSSLSAPLRTRSAVQETARRYLNLSEEDATSIAEDLDGLADSYSSSSSSS